LVTLFRYGWLVTFGYVCWLYVYGLRWLRCYVWLRFCWLRLVTLHVYGLRLVTFTLRLVWLRLVTVYVYVYVWFPVGYGYVWFTHTLVAFTLLRCLHGCYVVVGYVYVVVDITHTVTVTHVYIYVYVWLVTLVGCYGWLLFTHGLLHVYGLVWLLVTFARCLHLRYGCYGLVCWFGYVYVYVCLGCLFCRFTVTHIYTVVTVVGWLGCLRLRLRLVVLLHLTLFTVVTVYGYHGLLFGYIAVVGLRVCYGWLRLDLRLVTHGYGLLLRLVGLVCGYGWLVTHTVTVVWLRLVTVYIRLRGWLRLRLRLFGCGCCLRLRLLRLVGCYVWLRLVTFTCLRLLLLLFVD